MKQIKILKLRIKIVHLKNEDNSTLIRVPYKLLDLKNDQN